MRNKLFYKSAQKYLNKNIREHHFVTYNKAKNILLLFDSDEKDNLPIKKIIEELKDDNKSVTAWGFSKTKDSLTDNYPSLKLLDKRNINIFHKPKKNIINEVTSTNFDLLINLSLNDSLPLMYLSLYANATMKTGAKVTGFQLYDFIIDIKKGVNSISKNPINEQFLFKEVTFYLKSIQTTD